MFRICKNNFKAFTCLRTLTPFSTTTTPNPTVVDHLIKEFGFSKDKSISLSTAYPNSTSLPTLSTISHFFKQFGFSDTHIRNLISKSPKLLYSNNHQALKPKLELFQQLGLSSSSLADLIVSNPTILFLHLENYLVPAIDFLQSLLQSNENINKVFLRSTWFLNGFKSRVCPNINYLRQCGVPDETISKLLIDSPRFFTEKPNWVHDAVERIDKFGIQSHSPFYFYALRVIGKMSECMVDKKIKLFESYGWLESDIISAFKKSPQLLALSEGNVRNTMSFFIDELACNPRDIAVMPYLLNHSLEKRLKPRGKVLKMLNSKKLLKKSPSLNEVMKLTEEKFFEKYVEKFVDKAPDLGKVYKYPVMI